MFANIHSVIRKGANVLPHMGKRSIYPIFKARPFSCLAIHSMKHPPMMVPQESEGLTKLRQLQAKLQSQAEPLSEGEIRIIMKEIYDLPMPRKDLLRYRRIVGDVRVFLHSNAK